MNPARPNRRSREDGQILVLFAIAAIVIIAMVGLVLDGGSAFAQRREEQNGADLASLAGANAYMNATGNATAKTTAAVAAARAAATRNGYTHGANGVTVNVTVTLLASGANVQVDINKPHPNSFSRVIPGQGSWDVSVTATSTAGVIDTAIGAAPWTMSIAAFNPDGTPKYTSVNPQDFGEGNGDYPTGELDIAWTDFNGDNNVNTSEVRAIIDGSNVVTATFHFDQYLGQHNQGNHTALYGDVNSSLSGHDVPIPIVGDGPCAPNGQVSGCFKGWAIFHVISAHGGSQKTITRLLQERFQVDAPDRRGVHRGDAGRRPVRHHPGVDAVRQQDGPPDGLVVRRSMDTRSRSASTGNQRCSSPGRPVRSLSSGLLCDGTLRGVVRYHPGLVGP